MKDAKEGKSLLMQQLNHNKMLVTFGPSSWSNYFVNLGSSSSDRMLFSNSDDQNPDKYFLLSK